MSLVDTGSWLSNQSCSFQSIKLYSVLSILSSFVLILFHLFFISFNFVHFIHNSSFFHFIINSFPILIINFIILNSRSPSLLVYYHVFLSSNSCCCRILGSVGLILAFGFITNFNHFGTISHRSMRLENVSSFQIQMTHAINSLKKDLY
jgi:hypothetical protein